MKKFKSLSLALALVLCLALPPLSVLAVDQPSVGARAAIVVDADSGEVYYEKNADQTIQPASTTKIMTALLTVEAIERGELSLAESVAATQNSQYNLDEESTNANPLIQPGEVMTVQDLLYCAMLVSANEACNILAERVAGTVSGFVDLMNERARELGCSGTHFSNANGLEDSDHYSTAADFARIGREAMTHTLFQQIYGTQKYTVPETNVTGARELVNTNALLDRDSQYYREYAYGIKTGFFTNAGYCLVSAASRNDINVICVVMGGQAMNDQFADSITLLEWVFDNYELRQVLSSAETIVTVPVRLGTAETTGVRAENSLSVVLPRDYDISKIGYQYVLYHEQNNEKLEAPVTAGQVLGEITVAELDDSGSAVRTFGSSQLVAASTVEMSRGDYITTQLRELMQADAVRRIITILIILLAAYLLLVLFYYIRRVRHFRSMRQARRSRARRQAEEETNWLRFPDEPDRDPGIDFFSVSDPRPGLPAGGRSPSRSRDQNRSRSQPQSRNQGQSRGRAQDQGRNRAQAQNRSRSQAQSRNQNQSRGRAQDRSREQNRGQGQDRAPQREMSDWELDEAFSAALEREARQQPRPAPEKSAGSSRRVPTQDFPDDDFFDSFFRS